MVLILAHRQHRLLPLVGLTFLVLEQFQSQGHLVKSDGKSSSDSSRQSSEEPDSTATTSKPGVTASNTNEGKQDSKKKDGGKNRRHHSDINLAANVGQLKYQMS
jgi:hypothetical protein